LLPLGLFKGRRVARRVFGVLQFKMAFGTGGLTLSGDEGVGLSDGVLDTVSPPLEEGDSTAEESAVGFSTAGVAVERESRAGSVLLESGRIGASCMPNLDGGEFTNGF